MRTIPRIFFGLAVSLALLVTTAARAQDSYDYRRRQLRGHQDIRIQGHTTNRSGRCENNHVRQSARARAHECRYCRSTRESRDEAQR